MTARLTDEHLAELERECLTPGPVDELVFIGRALRMSAALPSLLAEVRELRWEREAACENTPARGCECPGCETARARALAGEAKP